jgi:hypothetical protein
MAFIAQTLFPSTPAGEGTNNRKVLDVSAGAGEGSTTCGFGTSNTVRFILAKPGAANSTSATPAAAQDFGWNVLKADMNQTGIPNRRHILAGDWTFHCVLSASTADAASSSYGVKVYVHKRSAAGALTELFNITSAFATISTSINVTVTKTSVAEIFLELDETIQIEYWVQGRGGGATGLLSQTITFRTGTTTLFQEVDFVLPSPGIRTRYARTLAVVMLGLISTFRKKIKIRRLVTMVGVATLARKLTLHRSMPVIMVGMVGLARKLTLRRTMAVMMVGVVVGIKRRVRLPRLVIMVGLTPTNSKKIRIRRLITMTGVVTLRRKIKLLRLVTMVGVTTLARRLTLRRTLTVTMTGVARAFAKLPFDRIPGGSAVIQIIKKIIVALDD